MPTPNASRSLTALLLLAAGGALSALPAPADELPTPVDGRDAVAAEIEPAGETDEYAIRLFEGDRLTVKSKTGGAVPGLLTTFTLFRPDSTDAGAKISGNGTKNGSVTYTASVSGVHVLRVAGGAGESFGAHGGYTLTFSVKRAQPKKQTFADPAGGVLAYRFGTIGGASIAVSASTRKGAFDLTGLSGPAGDETGFTGAVKASKTRRSSKVKKWTLLGGAGDYELQGTYEAGASVNVTVKVKAVEKPRKRSLGAEPQFKRGAPAVFPDEGVVGTLLTIDGEPDSFSYVNTPPRARRPEDPVPPPPATAGPTYDDPLEDVYPQIFIGAVEVPRPSIERVSGAFRFRAPAGLVTGPDYDITVRNTDGQLVVARGAFSIVPPPAPTGLSTVTGGAALQAGPGGGRKLRITGTRFRSGTLVVFDPDGQGVIVPPTVVLSNRIDVTAPPHAAGAVSLRIRDEFDQFADVPGTLTYLDVPSNEITSLDKAFLQALGGETVAVNGTDFGADTVLTSDGAEVAATLVSPAKLEYTTAPHADGTAELRVTDDLDQTSALTVTVKGFADMTATHIPAPRAVTDEADGWRATRVLAGDVTGDGRKDLVLLQSAPAIGASKSRSRLRVLAGNSNGSFGDITAAVVPAVSGDEDWRGDDMVLVDLNGDQKLDLAILTSSAVSSGTRSSLRLLRNDLVPDGSGGFSGGFTDKTADWAPPNTTTYTKYRDGIEDLNQGVALAACDVDHAGGTDLVIANTAYFTEVIETTTDPGDPTADPPVPPTVVTTTNYYPALRVLTNDGTGTLTRTSGVLPAVTATDVQQFQANALAVADVDGNGYQDIVLTRDLPTESPASTFHRTAILLKNSGGVFTDGSAAAFPAASDPEYMQADHVYLADMNGDTQPDLILHSNTPLVSPATGTPATTPALRLFVNSGGQFSAAASGTFPAKSGNDVSQGESLAIGDLDGDGLPDIVLTAPNAPSTGGRACRILRKSGTVWTDASVAFPNPLLGDDGRGTGVVLLDLGGDGDLDIVLVRNDAGETVRHTRSFFNQRK